MTIHTKRRPLPSGKHAHRGGPWEAWVPGRSCTGRGRSRSEAIGNLVLQFVRVGDLSFGDGDRMEFEAELVGDREGGAE